MCFVPAPVLPPPMVNVNTTNGRNPITREKDKAFSKKSEDD